MAQQETVKIQIKTVSQQAILFFSLPGFTTQQNRQNHAWS